MAYFKTIVTRRIMIPEFATAGQRHEEDLNNYLAMPTAPGKKREVENISTTQLINNGEIITTTVLCCEDEDY